MECALYGQTASGVSVQRYRLSNDRGLSLSFLDLGGIITEIRAPDRDGRCVNVVLGFSSLAQYEHHGGGGYFGALIGRYANRIAGARLNIGGRLVHLRANEGKNTLHGGGEGFDRALWQVTQVHERAARLSYVSQDGEGGFPGTLRVTVTYEMDVENNFHIRYAAECDAPSVLNLTQHTYFNLAGEGEGSIEDHHLEIAADHYTPIDAAMIPTGAIAPVAGTPLDFRAAKPIGRDLRAADPQLRIVRGFDHNFVLRTPRDFAARLAHPASGRTLDVVTSEPGLQLYTGNVLDGSLVGASGRLWRQGDGVALETQHSPDSPHHPNFPSTAIAPGETFRSETTWRFGVT